MSDWLVLRTRLHLGFLVLVLVAFGQLTGNATAADEIPTWEEVHQLLDDHPFTMESWPDWRERLLGWFGDETRQTDEAFVAAQNFVFEHSNGRNQLSHGLEEDAIAWYLLAFYHLSAHNEPTISPAIANRSKKALLESLRLDDQFARTHKHLALLTWIAAEGNDAEADRQARAYLASCRQLDPSLELHSVKGQALLLSGKYAEGITALEHARLHAPHDENTALLLAACYQSHLVNQEEPSETMLEEHLSKIEALVNEFPESGVLRCEYALAFAYLGEFDEAADELEESRRLGYRPEDILSLEVVEEIEQQAAPNFLVRFAWRAGIVALVASAFYAVVMGIMVIVAWVLAKFTYGTSALAMVSDAEDLVQNGRIVRTSGETWLARFYGLSLMSALALFYLSIPFVLLGIVTTMAGLLIGMFMAPVIYPWLVIMVIVIGGGMAFGVVKSLFIRMNTEGFGLLKTEAEEPQLYAAVREVAEQVHTRPIDEIYLGPGAEIFVHQEGRGPFGILGVKKRVLTIGMASLQQLTIDEFQSILAHEYAHFSHGDTFYSRIIYQVSFSIGHSIQAMAEAGGQLNYVNPFFWFFIFYYRAYHMMAAGFSRSREFLADRMAAALYGGDVFRSGLMNVVAKGTYCDVRTLDAVVKKIDADQEVTNMYADHRETLAETADDPERQDFFREVLTEKSSRFAGHPTISERMEAVSNLPPATQRNTLDASSLLSSAKAQEEALTQMFVEQVQQFRALEQQIAAANAADADATAADATATDS